MIVSTMAGEPHDPLAFARDLTAKLTPSRHVCAFLGAGASKAGGLPDIRDLEKAVATALKNDERKRFEVLLDRTANLEDCLSRLRIIASVLDGSETLDGLTKDSAGKLDAAICKAIVKAVGLEKADFGPIDAFASWAIGLDQKRPLEVFTPNYDLLIESGLERQGARYFDGFVGALEARFQERAVDPPEGALDARLSPDFVRLWKLHGSVNWAWEPKAPGTVVRLGSPVADGDSAAIYPSHAKYEESRRVPFVVLLDRFQRSLLEPETLVLFSGYAFGDQHLNAIIFDSAARRPRSEYMVFCHGALPDSLVARAEKTPSLSVVGPTDAVLGGRRASWDAGDAVDDVFDGKKLLLGDFANLAPFLARTPRGATPDVGV